MIMNTVKNEIKLAEYFLEMNETQRALMLEIMELITGNPARREFAAAWKGNMKDLPAALVKI